MIFCTHFEDGTLSILDIRIRLIFRDVQNLRDTFLMTNSDPNLSLKPFLHPTKQISPPTFKKKVVRTPLGDHLTL